MEFQVCAWMGYKVEPEYTEEWSRRRQRVGRGLQPISGEAPSRSEQALRAASNHRNLLYEKSRLDADGNKVQRSRSWAQLMMMMMV